MPIVVDFGATDYVSEIPIVEHVCPRRLPKKQTSLRDEPLCDACQDLKALATGMRRSAMGIVVFKSS